MVLLCINTLQNSFISIFAVLSNIMSWVSNQWDSWIFHGKRVLHSSSLHKLRLYGTLFKGKLLTGEVSFLRQIKSSLNNYWEWMKDIQKMKLSKFLRPPSQDFTDESSAFHRYPRIIQVKEQRINSGHWFLLYLHQQWTTCQMGKIPNLGGISSVSCNANLP